MAIRDESTKREAMLWSA